MEQRSTRSGKKYSNIPSQSQKSPSDDDKKNSKSITSVKRDIIDLTKQECEDWSKSLSNNNFINPLTKKPIIKNGAINKNIENFCKDKYNIIVVPKKTFNEFLNEMSTEDVKIWLSKPLINPYDNSKIDVNIKSSSIYAKLYTRTYDFLKENGKDYNEILETLPKQHLLFNEQLDILYEYVSRNDVDYTETHNSKYGIIFDGLFHEKNQKYIMNSDAIKKTIFANDDDKKHLERQILKIMSTDIVEFLIEKYKFSENSNRKLLTDRNFYNQYNMNWFEFIRKKIMTFKMFLQSIDHNYDEITREFDEIATNATFSDMKTVFQCFQYYNDFINDMQELMNYHTAKSNMEIIEDPLMNILQDPKFSEIDMDNLELKKRFFSSDEDYQKFLSEYNKKLDEYNKKEKGNSKSPPKRPEMEVFNNISNSLVKIQVGRFIIPQHINDSDYEKMKKEYNKKEHILNEYKLFIEKGFLDLTGRNNDNIDEYDIPNLKLTKKEILENDLTNKDSSNDQKNKCNGNIDIMTQERFDEEFYPYAKLQLMVKLKSRDKNGNIKRTDCFYAPNIYNYIVHQAQNNKKYTNPLTKEELSRENLDDIMKSMKIIDKNLRLPNELIIDNKLRIEHEIVKEKGEEYYKVYIVRNFAKTDIIICNICYIPCNINFDDTGVTNMTSDGLLSNVQELFKKGKLLHIYIPPYNKGYSYIKIPEIDMMNTTSIWKNKFKNEKIELFKDYCIRIASYSF